MSTFVLIHGAYQGGWIWRDCARALWSKGHRVFTPTLDGCGERKHLLRAGISVESHAEELAELLFFEDLDDVIAVGTSTGGMVLCRLAELARERIGKVVFADALALFDGEALPDIVTRKNAVTTEFGTGPTEDDLRGRLFADLRDDVRDWASARTTLHPRAVMEAPVKLSSFWRTSWNAQVIFCRRSANPPRAHQERAASKLGATWAELDCGHYPKLEKPLELATLLADEQT